jgi:hypothetical protein
MTHYVTLTDCLIGISNVDAVVTDEQIVMYQVMETYVHQIQTFPEYMYQYKHSMQYAVIKFSFFFFSKLINQFITLAIYH